MDQNGAKIREQNDIETRQVEKVLGNTFSCCHFHGY